jgi:hypothetical protein
MSTNVDKIVTKLETIVLEDLRVVSLKRFNRGRAMCKRSNRLPLDGCRCKNKLHWKTRKRTLDSVGVCGYWPRLVGAWFEISASKFRAQYFATIRG